LRRGFLLGVATVAWNLVEGIIALTAGALAGSVALVGFGVDSLIETTSGAVVGWRFLREMRGLPPDRAERAERSASRVAGGLLFLLALYILADSARRLLGHGPQPQESMLGIALTAVSLVVMPFLGWAKLRTARALTSGALRADAFETIACAWLSLTTLTGLLLNAAFGWSWADPLAALVLVPLIVREGMAGIRGED
jgi:divalent metal cation (Fe/Co/Zn/Cd) transporter